MPNNKLRSLEQVKNVPTLAKKNNKKKTTALQIDIFSQPLASCSYKIVQFA